MIATAVMFALIFARAIVAFLWTRDRVHDGVTGDLYAASDFGVSMLPDGETSWVRSARGLPNVEVAGLTIVPSERILYAATHGLSAWKLDLTRRHDDH